VTVPSVTLSPSAGIWTAKAIFLTPRSLVVGTGRPNEVVLCLTSTQTPHLRLVNILTIFSSSLVNFERVVAVLAAWMQVGRPRSET
jgi:hypothetical protein